jgi:hypothetical protein
MTLIYMQTAALELIDERRREEVEREQASRHDRARLSERRRPN